MAGVTVRTLHRYGSSRTLLRPARSGAGYRVYRERDLERLEQIVALKFLGLRLRRIRELLECGVPGSTRGLHTQLAALEDKAPHVRSRHSGDSRCRAAADSRTSQKNNRGD